MGKENQKKDNFKKIKTRPDKSKENTSLKTWQKDALSVLFIYAVVLFLFSDFIFQNKVFTSGGDITTARAITNAGKHLTEKEDQFPLWFPYIFSGMPSFASGMYGPADDIPLIKYQKYFNPMHYIGQAANVLFLYRDHSWEVAIFFFAGLFMFILARSLGFSQMIALCASVAYMLNNFLVASVAAGHGGKSLTMAYIPIVLWSVLRFYKERSLMNWSVMGFVFGSFFINPGHTQIVYYAFLMLGIYFIFMAFENWKSDKLAIVKNGSGLALAMMAGLGFGALNFFSQYVYSDVTMRAVAPAFAEAGEVAAGSGMTFDYITNWSFHPLESVTFFVPTFFGLESPYYWGWMTFTSSAFYVGLLTMVAAVFAIIYRRNRFTWFLIAVAILALLISFGRFFESFFSLMLSVLPFFDKFRVPSMILSLFMFAFSLLSCYGLEFLFSDKDEDKKIHAKIMKGLLYTLIGAGVVLIIALIFKDGLASFFSFLADGDDKRYNAQQLDQLKRMRLDALAGGLIKFSVLLGIIFSVLYFRLKGTISAALALPVLLVTLTADMIIINKPGLRPQSKTAAAGELRDNAAMQFMRNDTTLFRIYPVHEHIQQGSPVWANFGLENIGGYSPTKMRIYQDIIDFSFYKGPDKNFPINMNIVNMLNVKYMIANGQLPEREEFKIAYIDQASKLLVYENTKRLPRAFFVKQTDIIPDKKDVLYKLNSPDFNPAQTAILEVKPEADIIPYDSARVNILSWRTNRILLEAETDQPSLLVLSEMYYPHGWKAFIDGQETPIYKTNYILRSVCIPKGKHAVEFRFDPAEFTLGQWVSTITFFGVTGLMLVTAGMAFYRNKQRVTGNDKTSS